MSVVASHTLSTTTTAKAATTPALPVPASARTHSGTAGTTPTVSTPPASRAATVSSTTSTGGSAIHPLSSTGVNARPRVRAHSSAPTHLSAEAVVLVVLAVVLLLACAAWAFARSRAYEPHWLLSLRHAMAEAGYRTSATWAEFMDWARLGR